MVYEAYFAVTYFNNTVQDYLIFLSIFILSVGVMYIFKFYLISILKRFAKKTKSEIDDIIIDVVQNIKWPFYMYMSLIFSSNYLILPQKLNTFFDGLLFIVLAYYGVVAVNRVITYLAKLEVKKRKEAQSKASVIRILATLLKMLAWIVGLLFVLANFGVQITPLIASLGIGGVAIAFALQKILEDLFSSFVIYFDEPFKEDDFIVVGGDAGTVKHIGIKTTRLQALQGQELIIPNTELTNSRINNYKQMEKRRIPFTIGVTYDTPTTKLKKIPKMVDKIITDLKSVDFDRCHFKEFADSSLNFEIVYYVKSKEYLDYMNAQQDINFKIKEAFDKEKIEFAFPTQTIYLEK